MYVKNLLAASVFALVISCRLASSFAAWRLKAKPMSAAELALYKGNDREKILLEGAKKEGQVTFYTSNTWVAGPVRRSSRRNIRSSKPTSGAAIRKSC